MQAGDEQAGFAAFRIFGYSNTLCLLSRGMEESRPGSKPAARRRIYHRNQLI